MSINEIKKISDGTDEIEIPFEGDFLGRKALADSLEGYVSRLQVGATIAIDAEWGAGKSWFVNHWKKQLENNKYKVIYLNAFSQDYIDDPFLTISMEIANYLKADEKKIEKLKKGIGDVWRSFLPHAPMLIFSAITTLAGGGYFAQRVNEVINSFKDSGDFSQKFGEIINEQLEEHLTEQVESYQKEKQSLEYFKNCLKDITEKQDRPIIFIIDELDRCKPEFSIRLIERIKHFFDVPKVVFALSMNKNQLKESINSYYGFKNNNNYLDKFIDFTVALERLDNKNFNYDIALKTLLNKIGLFDDLKDNYYFFYDFCKILKPNPRELIKILNKFSLFYRINFTSNQVVFLFLVLVIIELNKLEYYNIENFNRFIRDNINNYYESEYIVHKSSIPVEFRSELDIYTYIYHKFTLTGFSEYIEVLSQRSISDPDSSLKEKFLKYFPIIDDENVKNDLIHAWHNYIYMIDVLIEED